MAYEQIMLAPGQDLLDFFNVAGSDWVGTPCIGGDSERHGFLLGWTSSMSASSSGSQERTARRVTFVTTTVERGGAEAMLLKLIQRMDKSQFAVTVINLSGDNGLGGELELAGARVVNLGTAAWWGRVLGLLRAPAAVARSRPDIVQGWMVHGNLAAQLAGFVCGKPVLWSVRHSSLDAKNEKAATRVLERSLAWLSKHPVCIVYNSDEGRRHHERLGYWRERSKTIPNGFDLQRFRPNPLSREKIRAELGTAPDAMVVGMIARFHPVKDHETLLKAAATVRKKYARLAFFLVGAGCDPQSPRLREMIERHGVQDIVIPLGERQDVDAIASAIDIGALCSTSEGFPNSIGELMASGVPCIVTNVGDCSWLVGESGIAVPARDAAAFSDALDQMLGMTPQARTDLGVRARERIMENFSMESVVHSFEQMYWEVELSGT